MTAHTVRGHATKAPPAAFQSCPEDAPSTLMTDQLRPRGKATLAGGGKVSTPAVLGPGTAKPRVLHLPEKAAPELGIHLNPPLVRTGGRAGERPSDKAGGSAMLPTSACVPRAPARALRLLLFNAGTRRCRVLCKLPRYPGQMRRGKEM